MISHRKFISSLLLSLNLIQINFAFADLPPSIVDIVHPNGRNTFVRDVNDSGQVAGFTQEPFPVLDYKAFRFKDGIFEQLDPIPTGTTSEPYAINNSGTVVGRSILPKVNPSQFNTTFDRATIWNGPGAGTDLGASNTPPDTGASVATGINDSGFVVGGTTHCFPPNTTNCPGVFVAAGNGMELAVNESFFSFNGQVVNAGTTIQGVNNSGAMIADLFLPGFTGNYALIQGGNPQHIELQPRAILSNGTVIGNKPGGGIGIRPPGGAPIETINCGQFVDDANDAGDILITSLGFDGMRLWHQGTCYKLSELLPEGVTGYFFPSNGASFTHPSINNLGQIATSATKTGVAATIAVLLTPRFPFAIEITSTPTGTPGEYEFEAVTKRGTAAATMTWDFGDGSAPLVSGSKVKKKFTKPGTFTIKGKATDSSNSNLTSTASFTVTVAAPKLLASIILPDFSDSKIPLGTTFKVDVNVAVSNDGVGDISDITFQGGTFTQSNDGILEYTTASTSPFSLAPGTGNSFPLNVKASGLGTVTLSTILIGKDANGSSVSGNADKSLEVVDAAGGDLLTSVGAVDKSGKSAVLLTNNTKGVLGGSFKFIKPVKSKSLIRSMIQSAAKNKTPKVIAYSKTISFSLNAGEAKTFNVKPKKETLETILSGKSVKATLQIDLTSALAGSSVKTIPVVLKKEKIKKK